MRPALRPDLQVHVQPAVDLSWKALAYTMRCVLIKGGTAPPIPISSKISMFCALSQNYQLFFFNDICIL